MKFQEPYITALFLDGVRAHLRAQDHVEVEFIDGYRRVAQVPPSGFGGLTRIAFTDGASLIVAEPLYGELGRTYRVTERDRSVEISRMDRVMDRLADQDHP